VCQNCRNCAKSFGISFLLSFYYIYLYLFYTYILIDDGKTIICIMLQKYIIMEKDAIIVH